MLLVDAYNVLHVTGVLPPHLAVGDVEALAALIGAGKWAGQRVRLICDGVPGPNSTRDEKGIEIVYAGPGADADSLIERLILENTAPRRLTVVSSDRRLKAAARRRRCKWMSSEDFMRSLARPVRRISPAAHPPTPLPQDDVGRWIREFGLEDAARPGAPGFLPASSSPKRPGKRPGKSGDSLVSRLSNAAGASNGLASEGDTDAAPDEHAVELDPTLLEALEEWRGRLDPDDLDMARWIDTHPPSPDS